MSSESPLHLHTPTPKATTPGSTGLPCFSRGGLGSRAPSVREAAGGHAEWAAVDAWTQVPSLVQTRGRWGKAPALKTIL